MSSNLEIVNSALVSLGESKITSFLEDSDKADTCRLKYADLVGRVLSMYSWRFNTKKRQLAQETATPTNEWTYQYALPTDRVAPPHAVFNSTSAGVVPFQDWEIFEDKLFTDATVIVVDYRYKASEGNWPPYFVAFVVDALAAALCMPITEKADLARHLHEVAWGTPSEGMRGGAFAIAAQIDAAGNVGDVIEDFSLIRARY